MTLVVVAALGTAAALACSGPMVRLVFAGYGMLGLAYGMSMFRGFRLKQVPGLKSWIVTLAAMIGGIGLPLSDSGRALDLDALEVALVTFATLAVAAHLCDVIDIGSDRAHGTRTLPILIGVGRTKAMLRAIVVLCAVALMVGWRCHAFSFHPEILVLLACNLVLTYLVTPETPGLQGYLLVETTLLLIPLGPPLHAGLDWIAGLR
jgi:4-hydroxybenzoate polyprenyltransferase